MKTGMFGCLVGSAAALLLGGCAMEDDTVATAPVYRSTQYASYSGEPIFVERRAIVIDNRRRVVPIYRTGDRHFYTWGGRQVALADYPTVRTTSFYRPRTAYIGSSYRDVNLDDDYTERTLVPIAEAPETVSQTTTRTVTVQPEREVITEYNK